ncbi:AraC family transcriptional regulator [Anaerovorax odorimutans]|uniref:AraC family transcriptional regulator n=1 Tax=Anaerovorax odorimutans TaxID=109327 RepID=A0ABT1RRQ5_9FIRM|nr:AraC family transcriptional regulator [Anaerovorax odorimutans]MCQ4637853.1 AraC family transcriptional regulator [Anaerovorax odorimutans]
MNMHTYAQEETITYERNTPFEIKLCNLKHINPHYHTKELELVFCLKGSVDLSTGHQHVTLQAGQLFSVDCRDIHLLSSAADNLTLIFHLNLTELEVAWDYLQYVYFACESCHCFPYQRQAAAWIEGALFTLAYTHYSQTAVSEEEHFRLANKMVQILLKYFNWYNYENRDSYINADLYDRFHRIMIYCQKNYQKKITISQLAEAEHIDRNYFSQFLSKTNFQSFSRMVQYIRCFEAERLLLTTSLSVSEISFACGFSDPKYFYAAFKLFWSCTPTEHRLRCAQFMKKPAAVEFIQGPQVPAVIMEYLTKWHVGKTFSERAVEED